MLFGVVLDYSLTLLKGAFVTLAVGMGSLLFSVVIGVFVAFFKLSENRLLRFFATVYTTIIRGIPDIVLLLLIYYGGQVLLNEISDLVGLNFYVTLSPLISGVMTIGIIFGAYMSETFRGAFQSIDRGQIEAAKAFDIKDATLFFSILLPQLFFHGLSAFTNNWLVLLKTTSLVSIIGLNDMVRVANVSGSSTQQPFIFYFFISIIYLLFTSLSLWGLDVLKRRYHFS